MCRRIHTSHLHRFVASLEQQKLKHCTIKPTPQASASPNTTTPRQPLPGLVHAAVGIRICWQALSMCRPGLGSHQSQDSLEIMGHLKTRWLHGWHTPDNIMLWAAACTGFSGFLQAGEFTVLSVQSYDPEVHLSFSDLAMECHTAPSLFHIRREPFKTDPFRQGADIFVGATNTSTSVRTFAQPKDQCMIPEAGRG